MSKKKIQSIDKHQIKLDLFFPTQQPKNKTIRGLNKILRAPVCRGWKQISTPT